MTRVGKDIYDQGLLYLRAFVGLDLSGSVVVLASMMHERLAAALAYWEGKRAGRRLPSRRDIDPLLEIPRLLPWVILVDVLKDPLDFRLRIIGQEIVDRARRNFTGCRFSELPHAGPESLLWKHRALVVETREPLVGSLPYVGPQDRIGGVSELFLPLSMDDCAVRMILSVVVFNQEQGPPPGSASR
jgi:hypothetical protein